MENDTLTDVEKFNYLKSLLERSAYDAIAGLTLSDANYVEAVAILQKRFGNKQVIISKHMEVLLNLDPVSSVHKLRELRQLYDTVESHTRSLRSLGIEPASYGAMLSSVFLAKLPQEVRIVVSRKSLSKDEPSMEEMMKAFEEELTARERVSVSSQLAPGLSSNVFMSLRKLALNASHQTITPMTTPMLSLLLLWMRIQVSTRFWEYHGTQLVTASSLTSQSWLKWLLNYYLQRET